MRVSSGLLPPNWESPVPGEQQLADFRLILCFFVQSGGYVGFLAILASTVAGEQLSAPDTTRAVSPVVAVPGEGSCGVEWSSVHHNTAVVLVPHQESRLTHRTEVGGGDPWRGQDEVGR